MDIEINVESHVPIYVQIIDQIKHKIASGELQPSDQLPTVRQLAADLRVNFNTIARAYRLLDEARIISTQHGRGTFILDRPADTSAEALRREDLIRLTRTYLTQAHHLDYKPEEVQALFEEELGEWQDNGAPPAPEGE